jgi:hypothetical protein
MNLRVAVLGAGPVGLEAALQGLAHGWDVTVFEAGVPGENVEMWGHVTLFSPWRLNVSPLGLETLAAEGAPVRVDPDALPTGREYRGRYLEPLSRSRPLRGRIRERHRVVAVGREGLLKGDRIGDPSRAELPFRILVETPEGERVFSAEAVIDATGTYAVPNWIGAGGVPAPGEREARERISYLLDDPSGSHRAVYRGRRTLLVGCGYSAATSLLAFRDLLREEPGTSLVWATRTAAPRPFPRIAADPLPGRDRLAAEANRTAERPPAGITRLPGRVVTAIRPRGETLEVDLASPVGVATERVDRILANVGYRPDRQIFAELQVHECYATGGPMRLAAALLDETSGDCLAQTGRGPASLASPEPRYLILGAKSYGRRSNFLLRIGFEQVRDAYRLLGGLPDRNVASSAAAEAR